MRVTPVVEAALDAGITLDGSLDVLADEWNADVLRISMYIQEGGYETDPAGFTAKVNDYIEKATARGMYAMIDFHTLTPGDPNYNLDRAKTFFAEIEDLDRIVAELEEFAQSTPWVSQQLQPARSKARR